MSADRLIRALTAGVVLAVAAFAAIVAYSHIFDLGRAHGQVVVAARLLPLSVDGLIAAASLVMLHEAARQLEGGKARAAMQFTYDLDAGALYVKLGGNAVARTAEIDDCTLIDLDGDGSVVGIEVTSITRSLPLDVIIRQYSIPAAEEAQLRAYFEQASGLAAPRLSAEPIPAACAG